MRSIKNIISWTKANTLTPVILYWGILCYHNINIKLATIGAIIIIIDTTILGHIFDISNCSSRKYKISIIFLVSILCWIFQYFLLLYILFAFFTSAISPIFLSFLWAITIGSLYSPLIISCYRVWNWRNSKRC